MVHRLVLGIAKVSLLGAVVTPEQMKAVLSTIKLSPDYAVIPLPKTPSKRFVSDMLESDEEEEH